MARIRQSFRFDWKDKVFGCSFRKDHRNGQYFGWVTVYDSPEQYENPTRWTDWKNIALAAEKPIDAAIELRKFCKRLAAGEIKSCDTGCKTSQKKDVKGNSAFTKRKEKQNGRI